ncbi:hypothetical protein GLA29479_2983 [Lysobacter antibioticus]|nr:hypothetical protein GLA29479_2983 [Lysobacter antibioticus]
MTRRGRECGDQHDRRGQRRGCAVRARALAVLGECRLRPGSRRVRLRAVSTRTGDARRKAGHGLSSLKEWRVVAVGTAPRRA